MQQLISDLPILFQSPKDQESAEENDFKEQVLNISDEIKISPGTIQIVPLNNDKTVGGKGETHALDEICSILAEFKRQHLAKVGVDALRANWMLVAVVVDRFLLLLFVLLTIIASCAILLNRPSYDDL